MHVGNSAWPFTPIYVWEPHPLGSPFLMTLGLSWLDRIHMRFRKQEKSRHHDFRRLWWSNMKRKNQRYTQIPLLLPAPTSYCQLPALLTKSDPKVTTRQQSCQNDRFRKDNRFHRGSNLYTALHDTSFGIICEWSDIRSISDFPASFNCLLTSVLLTNMMSYYLFAALTPHFQNFISSLPSIFM